jgi:sugar lactone lactonase YvrE
MNFYPLPPTLKASLYARVPDELRCIGHETEWRAGLTGDFKGIFLEGPVADDAGNLYVVDIPFGRILKIDIDRKVSVMAQWDGEPNGLAATKEGDLLVADYKQVCLCKTVSHALLLLQ